MKRVLKFFLMCSVVPLLCGAERPWSVVDVSQITPQKNESAQILDHSTFGEKSLWSISRTVHGPHPDKEKILEYCTSLRKEGTLLIRIDKAVSRYKSRTGAVQMVSSGVNRYLKLSPEAAGKTLSARFKSAGKGMVNGFIVFQKGKKNILMVKGFSATVPAGAETAVIICRLTGPGELLLQEVTVSLEKRKMNEDIICCSMDYLDRKFYLPEKGSCPVFFVFKRDRNKVCKSVQLCLELPKGVRVAGADKTVDKIAQDVIDVKKAFYATITKGGGFCCWRPLMLTLEADRKLNGEIFRYHLSVDGEKGPVHELKLYTMPRVKVAQPAGFKSGIFMQWNGALPQKVSEEYAQLLADSGFNFFRNNFSPELLAELEKNNIDTCENWNYIRDGYPIFPKKENPAPFLDVEGKTVRNQLCPIEVYTRGPAYKEYIQPEIHRVLSKNTFFVINWEVYNSDYKGCFCQKCMAEFIKYSKQPAEKIKALWPRKVVAAYHDIWVKFRSHQHGLVCKTLAEDMGAVRKGKTHFMPMVSITCFNEESAYCPQYHPDDYLKHLKWINVWGPYFPSVGMNKPLEYTPGRYLHHYYAVANVVEYFKKHGGKDVKITGLPYGSHAFNANLPEAVALELHNNYILGYQGSMLYWFHFDYRYWSLMAKANAKIAATEKMVRVWDENNNVKAVPVTPHITDRHWKIHLGNTSYCPGFRSAKSALITHAWSKGDSTLAAVGNFWEKGDVFFRLILPGKKGSYVIRTPYAPYKHKFVSGEELAKGVLLHISPLNWEYFLIEKRENKSYPGTLMEVEKEMALLKGDILEKYAGEEKLLKEMEKLFKITDYGFGETPEITASQVKLTETSLAGKQALLIRTPVYQAVLAPAQSGQIKSLIVDKKELVLQDNPSGSFGKPGFWRPKARLIENTPFRIFNIKAEKDHVKVIMERPQTMGFDLQIVWKFYEKSMEESFTVRNATKLKQETILRFHHMPMHLANGTKAQFQIGAEKFTPFEKDRFFICRPGVLGKAANIKGGDTVFTSAAMSSKLIHHPFDPMEGYYFWNNPGAVTGTFEPVFSGKKLAPGEKLTIRQLWKIEK